jgi:hypothetical protein
MGEMHSSANRQASIVTPFNAQSTPLPFPSASQYEKGHNNSSTDLTYQTLLSDRGESGYGGSSESLSGRQYHSRGTPLKFVTSRAHSQSPDTAAGVYSSTIDPTANSDNDRRANPNRVETIRRARQNEIEERLRAVQQEVIHLTSDLRGGNGGRQLSERWLGTTTQGNQEMGEGEEMSMVEMREQLRVMREQIEYLREQQRSAWAQGLSDDPPPGYTPASTTASRYSVGSALIPPS